MSGRRARIIVLLGIDGAGKTTTAAALVAAERESGREAILLRNRSGRRWLARTSARFGVEVPVRWADRVETVVRTANVLVAQARAGRRDGLVVIDRHLVCQLVLRRVRGLPPGRVLPWLSARWLHGAVVVVLDVPAETARARILARGEDDESLEYLRTTRATYLEFAGARGWAVVDATGAPEAVLARLTGSAVLR
ncbi:thymidylate kinase [Kocuria dechangensis]|uniref:Thymidylate kinase n=1 Tax=Kocuria dechangensis TaxID=1176249 RepID=A0A917H8L6_9MICC|nr:AAA family ATPase [Kocuria dechangensis]GGG71066.1 thymidylate kinase [Kocuria dechangensis]